MRTPSLAGDGAGSGQVGKGGRVDTTPAPWPQPKPPPDFDHVKCPILARHWFGIGARNSRRGSDLAFALDLERWPEQPVNLSEISVPELV